MSIRGASLFSRAAVFFAIVFGLSACGGGGGGGDVGFLPPDPPQEQQLILTLFGPDGEETSVVTATKTATLRVRVDARNNVAVSGIVVNATTDLGRLVPSSGSALTDSNGEATFLVEAAGDRGAGTLRASATVDGETVTGSLGFQVGETNFRLGYFDTDGSFVEGAIKIEPQSNLSAGGNAQLSVVILDSEGNRVTTAEEVIFNSGCIAALQSTINPASPVTSLNGQATTLYTAASCAGQDDITASLVGTGAQAFGTLTVASPSANAVLFVSAEPQLIVLRGTGGQNRDETAEVIFQVVDGIGQPLQGVVVNFDLTTRVGGITLSTPSAFSDGEGQVKVTVSAGDVATTLRVIATIDDGSGNPISTVSDLLTVTTGLPDQNSISLAVSDSFVVDDAMREDGLTRQLTVSMADKFNNPVVDGTSAVFTTEYGAIVGSCNTVDGVCSVQWRSQQPRFPTLTDDDFVRTIFDPDYDCPGHRGSSGPCLEDLGYIRGGRSTIMVHAIGEESFIDRNGNGVFDQSEANDGLFDNLPEAFIDHNEDGVYTPAIPECLGAPMATLRCIAGQEEIFVDFNSNDTYDLNDTPAVYNGLLCPPEGDGVWCSRDLVHVFAQTVVTLSDSPGFDILLLLGDRPVTQTTHLENHIALIADTYNNPPAAGSTVSVSVSGDCELLSEPSFDVPNIFGGTGAYWVPVITNAPDSLSGDPGFLTIRVEDVDGDSYTEVFECDDDPCDGFSPLPDYCLPPDPNAPAP